MTYRARHRAAATRPGTWVVAGLVTLVVIGGALVAFLVLVHTANPARAGRGRPGRQPTAVSPSVVATSSSPPTDTPAPRFVPFAEADGVTLRLPAPKVACVCFHEASYGWTRELTPIGRLAHDYNRTKYSPRLGRRAPGPRYIVMSSRGRRTGATTAADLVLARGTPVASPVSGVVTKVRRYRLYGRYPDLQVEIRPESHPELRVVLIHLDEVRVRPGQPVTATRTVLGVPRVFPFGSQTDDYIRGGLPHVHVEITTAHHGSASKE